MLEIITMPEFWVSTAAAFAAAEGMSLLKRRLKTYAESLNNNPEDM